VSRPFPYAPKYLRDPLEDTWLTPRDGMIAGLPVHHPRYGLIPPRVDAGARPADVCGCLSLARRLHRQIFRLHRCHYVFPDGLAAVLIGRSLGIPVALTARGTDIHTFPAADIRPQIRWALRHAAELPPCQFTGKHHARTGACNRVSRRDRKRVDGERFFAEDRLLARKKIGLNADEKIW